MLNKIILASKSKVRKEILDNNNIPNNVIPSNVDEEIIKESLIKAEATPEIISKNLAELKANKISISEQDKLVLGADSVIDLKGELISKPDNREEAFNILRKLNGETHYLISSVCLSKNGVMIWNYTDKAILTMKKMSEDELNQRMLASHCGFNLQSFINHGYAKSDRGRILEQMTGSIPELEAGPLHICPRTDITIGQLRAETRRLVSKRGVKLVIVDYMQLVGVAARRGASRVDEVGEISRGLKKMALELDLPVIALAQLNRSIENDNNRSPRLSDLRESGSIEADSDVVIFIHREKKGVFIDSRMLCQIVIGKNRNGPQGVFDLCFDREVCRFEDWRKHQDLVAEAEKLRS